MKCGNNISCDITLNATLASFENTTYSDSVNLSQLEIGLMLTLSIATTVLNLIVLCASKFTSGGETPTLVFIRSLCVGDVLLGIYGMSKMLMLLHIDILMVNFFLPESLFFTASLASSLSLLALNVDCSLKLSQPMQYLQHMDKKNIITCMVLLWNLSFIIGFLPQIGWNSDGHVLQFFSYFTLEYLLFHGILLFITIILNISLVMFLRNKINQITTNRTFMSSTSREFQRYRKLVVTTVIDTCLWLGCSVPFYIYLGLYCKVCLMTDDLRSNKNVLYFIPVFLLKSFISALVHGYRTAQIKSVIKKFSRGMSKIVQNSKKMRRSGLTTVYTTSSLHNSDGSDDAVTYDGPISRIGSTYSKDTFKTSHVTITTSTTSLSPELIAIQDETTVL